MSKYDAKLNINENNPLSLLIRNMEKNSTVLEFGPATGRMTRYLKEELNCKVYIVEIDEECYQKAMQYAEGGFLGNIEEYKWIEQFKGFKFDYIFFADVLEHLYNPKNVLQKSVEFLKDNGKIGVSVPNIAHKSIITNLLKATFQYNSIGLLDNTHIKFFTYYSLKNMFTECGLETIKELASYLPAMGKEFPYDVDSLTPKQRSALSDYEYGNVYQFVFIGIKKEFYDFGNEDIIVEKNILKNKEKAESLLYIDTGNGFSINEYLIGNISEGYNDVCYSLEQFEDIRKLRYDFGEGDFCTVKIESLTIDEKNVDVFSLKGNCLFNTKNIYLFNNTDPYLYIDNFDKSPKNIHLKFYVEKIFDISLLNNCFENLEQEKAELIDGKNKLVQDYEAHVEFITTDMNNQLLNTNNQLLVVQEQLLDTQNELLNNESELLNTKNELSNYSQQLLYLQNNLSDYKNKAETKENELFKQIQELNSAKAIIERQLMLKSTEFDMISNSTIWKATKPLRTILNPIENVLRKNRHTYLFCRGLKFVKRYGVVNTAQRVNLWNKKRKGKHLKNNNTNNFIFNKDSLKIDDIGLLESINKSIAIHVHLYYVDLLDEFILYLNNMPYKFDLYVSCKKGSHIEEITRKLKTIRNVEKVDVRETINRGRDIAPLYVQFGREIEQYDYFLHVHSKKSLYSGVEKYSWRQYSLNTLLGSEEIIKKIFYLFESDKKIGLFFSETFDMHIIAHCWLANATYGKQLLESMGIEFKDGIFNYPVGSFFWARTDALKPIFEKNLKYEDFQEEAGQIDGTIAHALERVISFVTKSQGYQLGIVDLEEKTISLNKSLKICKDYFSLDINSVRYYLSQFDLVSFDIFDTLITRCVYKPDDIFKLIQYKIEKKFNIKVNFLEVRKKAEALAWEKKHAYCNIHDIYEELPKVSNISHDLSMKIKQIEIDTEFDISIPREDVLEIFNYLKQNRTKIVLVSDMYLTRDIVEKMLKKCGYEGYSDIWISCEKGLRKDNSTIWSDFFNVYGGLNTIHVGDNPRSDIQLVGDIGKMTFYVMNPITAFELSEHYKIFEKYIDTTIENSLMLGMLINGGLYNSFLSVNSNGEACIRDSKKLGYIAFGALFSNFIKWVDQQCRNDNKTLLFLAREGYVFEKLYNEYCNAVEKEKLKEVYFLTSRRNVSVAAINSIDDVKGILSQYYEGKLDNLLKARLGIELFEGVQNTNVYMPKDINEVMNIIKPHIDIILNKAQCERKAYIKYIDSVIKEEDNPVVVDVGYSGTIQYYLIKLLKNNIDGYYLSTYSDKKPEKLGAKCYAVYPVKNSEKIESKVFNNQLFLEAVLKAPIGQLLNFEEYEEGVKANYKNDNIVSEEIIHLQEGIYDYCKKYFSILKDISENVQIDKNLCEDIFDDMLKGDLMGEELFNIFKVQDDYCSNGNLKFNKNTEKWETV